MDRKALVGKKNGLFSVNSPVHHWRYQRLTAVALAPLSIWLIVLLDKALNAPYAETLAWLSAPINAMGITLWTLAVVYHAALGVQVVIEDYVSNIPIRHGAILVSNLVFLFLGAAALLSIFNILLIR